MLGSSVLSVPAAELRGFTERRQPIALALFVQPLESRLRHHHFAAHFECLCGTPAFWSSSAGMLSGTLRMVRMFEVTSSPVCPSPRVSPDDEPRAAVFGRLVSQRHAQAVELQLGCVFDREIAGQLAHAPVPVGQLLGRVGVVEREHGPRVLRLLEALGRLAAHALRRRVRRHQLRMRRFQPLQLVHQRVVLGVADLGRVENVIEMLVAAKFLPQLLDLARTPESVIRKDYSDRKDSPVSS